MPEFLTINTIDGSVEFPAQFVRFSGLLTEFAENAYDVDSTTDGWVQELVEADTDESFDLPMLTTSEVELYLQWCHIRPFIETSAKLEEYTEIWKKQMRLQKPHITDPVPPTPLPDRVEDSWTLESLVDDEHKQAVNSVFHSEYLNICENHSAETPAGSPFLNPPEWVLPLPAHNIPDEFPRELIGFWLKEYHFIDLNGVEIPEDIPLNNIQAADGQENVTDFLCQSVDRFSMPEIQPVVPDHTISDPTERQADVERRTREQFAAAVERIRSEISLPSKFPEELQQPWLITRLDDPTGYPQEAVQEYLERNERFLAETPHTDPQDPLWGVGAVVGQLILLGAEKFLDRWLESAATWQLSTMTDKLMSPEGHMRMMKYHNTPRVRQFLEASYFYG